MAQWLRARSAHGLVIYIDPKTYDIGHSQSSKVNLGQRLRAHGGLCGYIKWKRAFLTITIEKRDVEGKCES